MTASRSAVARCTRPRHLVRARVRVRVRVRARARVWVMARAVARARVRVRVHEAAAPQSARCHAAPRPSAQRGRAVGRLG